MNNGLMIQQQEELIQMAKFIKSIFQEKRKTSRTEGDVEERPDFTPPLDGRRQLSISRSGRMKQNKKNRHSLSLALYGDDISCPPKPKCHIEYHVGATPVNTPVPTSEQLPCEQLLDLPSRTTQDRTPDEEIDKAFEVIDKT